MEFSQTYKYLIILMIGIIFIGCLHKSVDDGRILNEPSMNEEMFLKYCEFSERRFDYRWWSYYARGLCFAYHGKFKKAEYDFRQALNQKKGDQWNAEMFGYSYIDYFPYRELGIVLYEQGRLIEALENLKVSNDKLKSARTEFYLNQVRKELISQGKIEDKHQ